MTMNVNPAVQPIKLDGALQDMQKPIVLADAADKSSKGSGKCTPERQDDGSYKVPEKCTDDKKAEAPKPADTKKPDVKPATKNGAYDVGIIDNELKTTDVAKTETKKPDVKPAKGGDTYVNANHIHFHQHNHLHITQCTHNPLPKEPVKTPVDKPYVKPADKPVQTTYTPAPVKPATPAKPYQAPQPAKPVYNKPVVQPKPQPQYTQADCPPTMAKPKPVPYVAPQPAKPVAYTPMAKPTYDKPAPMSAKPQPQYAQAQAQASSSGGNSQAQAYASAGSSCGTSYSKPMNDNGYASAQASSNYQAPVNNQQVGYPTSQQVDNYVNNGGLAKAMPKQQYAGVQQAMQQGDVKGACQQIADYASNSCQSCGNGNAGQQINDAYNQVSGNYDQGGYSGTKEEMLISLIIDIIKALPKETLIEIAKALFQDNGNSYGIAEDTQYAQADTAKPAYTGDDKPMSTYDYKGSDTTTGTKAKAMA